MKHPIHSKHILLLVIVLSAALSGCGGDEVKALAWEGNWKRTVLVPAGVEGRCVDEILELHNREWKLTAVIHSTYECHQPFLEMVFEGVVDQVKVQRDTHDRVARLQVSDIRMVGMSDIGNSGKVALSGSMVEVMSEKYVPEKFRFFEQVIRVSDDGSVMDSSFFPAVQEMAIPLYPEEEEPVPYHRVVDMGVE